MNKVDYMILVSEFTSHINKTLKKDQAVVNWDFCIEEESFDNRRNLHLHIKFVGDLHSRTVFDLIPYSGELENIERLNAQFDYEFEKSCRQAEALMFSKNINRRSE